MKLEQKGRSDGVTGEELEPISVRVADAVRLTGISRSHLYRLIASGDVRTAKVGRSTLILMESLYRLLGRDCGVVQSVARTTEFGIGKGGENRARLPRGRHTG